MILPYAEVCEGVSFNRYWVRLSPFLLAKGNVLTIIRMRRGVTSIRKGVW